MTQAQLDVAKPWRAATRSVQSAAGTVAAQHPTAIFLVGGSSRIALAATALHRALRVAPITLERPGTVVAEGAILT